MDIGIFVYEGADELDVVGPFRVFAEVNDVRGQFPDVEPVNIHIVAEAIGSVQLGGGLVLIPTDTFHTCPPVDVVLVPGGSSDKPMGRRNQQKNEMALEWIRQAAADAKVVGSVCTGAFILAEAGLLSSRRVNTHWAFRDELKEMMTMLGDYIEIDSERVVWDDNIVTCGGVTAGIDLALSIVEKKLGTEVRDAIASGIELETP